MSDQTYGEARARGLVQLLRALAARIQELEHDDALLAAGPELLRRMGDARSELFHYEVRCTYDTPEVAESRRIVDQARNQADALEFDDSDSEFDDPENTDTWRKS